ncbi:hypothetical protein ABPG75_000951 [Micractinium tetrahymenae]
MAFCIQTGLVITVYIGSVARGGVRTGELKEGVKGKIIYDLSIDNERLARELLQLKQYVLDVRRAARGCGCALNDTVLTLFPELHDRITEADVAAAGADVAHRAAAARVGGGSGAGAAAALSGSDSAAGGAVASQAGLAAGGALAAGARRHAAEAAVASTDAANTGERLQPVNAG